MSIIFIISRTVPLQRTLRTVRNNHPTSTSFQLVFLAFLFADPISVSKPGMLKGGCRGRGHQRAWSSQERGKSAPVAWSHSLEIFSC